MMYKADCLVFDQGYSYYEIVQSLFWLILFGIAGLKSSSKGGY
uniref:Uncharacterized protein n=1 Tax=Pseudomonas marincola TaxID=437900 RepID=A0A653E1G0_9PSED